jgi:hypothetical protein
MTPCRLLLSAVAVALTLSPGFAQDKKGRKVALLVGVGEYKFNLSNLGTAPERDVTELQKFLRDGGFEVTTLTGSGTGDAKATKANVEKRFTALLTGGGDRDRELAKGDVLLVALCGHGFELEATDPATKKTAAQPFFCPHDARPGDPATMVSLNGLIRAAEPHGCTTLFLVDACREVADPNRGTRAGIQGKKVTLPRETAILFACSQDQLSHQSEKAGGGHGLFTFAMLRTLKAELDGSGDVSWSGLVNGVEKRMRSAEFRAMMPPNHPQTPVLATGEMGYLELLSVDSLIGDARAFTIAMKRGGNKFDQFVEETPPDRVAAWKAAADAGNPSGLLLYGACKLIGVKAAVPKDEPGAFKLLLRAAEAGQPAAMTMVAFALENGECGQAKNEVEAVKWFTRAAHAGDGMGMLALGNMYQDGRGGLKKDQAAALAWYTRAAEDNHPIAMGLLASLYENGVGGVAKNEAEAVKWYRGAVELGDAKSMAPYGLMHLQGRGGLARNVDEALKWVRRGAEAGDRDGMEILAVILTDGTAGVRKDHPEAVKWYRKAADADSASALSRLGIAYYIGQGVEQDFKTAAVWFRKAADKGDGNGMNFLGTMYENGRGVPKDVAEAVKWYRKAADAGEASARDALRRLGKQ